MNKPAAADPRMLKMSAVLDRIPVTSKTLKTWIANGEFPAPLIVGGTRLWSEKAIEEFLSRSAA